MRMSPRAMREAAIIFECLALFSMLVSIGLLFHDLAAPEGRGLLVGTLAWVGIYGVASAHQKFGHNVVYQLPALSDRISIWVMAALVMLVMAFVTKTSEDLSRLWFGISFFSGMLVIGVSRIAMGTMARWAEGTGSMRQRVAIYGNEGDPAALYDRFFPEGDTRSFGLYDERNICRETGNAPLKWESGLDRLIERARDREIDTVLINLPWSAEDRIKQIVRRLETVNVEVLVVPPQSLAEHGTFRPVRLGQLQALSVFSKPDNGVAALFKAMMDRIFALLVLIALLPLLCFVAIAIRLESPGPIFFRQLRCGMNNVPFEIWKFRSMYHHMADHNGDKLTLRNDARVTKVGAFIRRTSIDELPQLLNILNGTMSIIGPRPHAYGAKAADRLYEDVVDRYSARHRMLPGITGLAQVRGFRGNTENERDIENRVASDLEYMDRWSLALDLSILVRTVIVVFVQRNAF